MTFRESILTRLITKKGVQKIRGEVPKNNLNVCELVGRERKRLWM